MHVPRLAFLLVCMSLAGCAVGLRVYEPPTGPALANFSVVDSSGLGLSAKEVSVAVFDDAKTCGGRSFIHGTTKQPALSTAFVPIRASEPLSVAFYFTRQESGIWGPVSTCGSIITFNPVPGLFYRAYFSADRGPCDVTLRSAHSSDMPFDVDVPFQRKRPRKAADENSTFCAP
jgi:hypothetical protein